MTDAERVGSQVPYTKPDRFIRCPECSKGEWRVDHLVGLGWRSFGPWYCDECGFGFTGAVLDDGTVRTRAHASRVVPTHVTLRLEEPVTLVVKGMRFIEGRDQPDDPDEHDRYYYEEHTCPTNFLKCVVEVYGANSEADPHGVCRYMGTRTASPDDDG
jgi:hypothetical protein